MLASRLHRITPIARPVAALLFCTFLLCGMVPHSAAQSGPASAAGITGWDRTPAIPIASYRHTATMLPDGSVLVVGGRDGSRIMSSCVRFIPATSANSCTWAYWPSLSEQRERHTTTFLPNGLIVTAGGINSIPTTSCEIFDPATGMWLSGPSMHGARYEHTATRLPGNRVLVVGSKNYDKGITGCEILEPLDVVTAPPLFRWRRTDSLGVPRGNHTATLLPDGRVLVTGGVSWYSRIASCEIFNPLIERWSPAPDLHTRRDAHTATLLPDGRVLVVGGDAGDYPLETCEIFDPAAQGGRGEWTGAPPLNQPHMYHTTSLVGDRFVVVVGTWDVGHGSRSVEVLDLQDLWAGWRWAVPTWADHTNFTATTLQDNRLLLIGGEIEGSQRATDVCEITMQPITSIGSAPSPSLPTFHPDPCLGMAQVDLDLGHPATLRMAIVNTLGATVYERSVAYDSGHISHHLDLGALSPGLYLFRIEGLEKPFTLKFMRR
jgi:hypothetical protein